MNPFRLLCVLAWRNLWRNARRTLLTASTISAGVALLMIFFGLEDGLHRQMLESAVHLGGAHVAVQAERYQASGDIALTLPADELARFGAVLQDHRFRAPALLPRVFASGLASSADGSTGIELIGLDPGRELPRSQLDEKLTAGSFTLELAGYQAVIGEGVARKLELSPGEKCVLMAQGPGSPDIQSVLVRVAGIVKTGAEDFDQAAVLVPLATAQALLGMPGRVHQLGLVLGAPDQAERAAGALRAAAGPGQEVLHWEQLMPSLRDFIRVDVAGLVIIDTIFFLIISFLVANTLLVSVLERRREFALLDAVGLTSRQRFLMIMLEASWIAVLAVAAGAAAGWAGHLYLQRYGLNLRLFTSSGWSAAGAPVDQVIYSALTLQHVAIAVGLILFLTVALALLPARRAATDADPHLLGQS